MASNDEVIRYYGRSSQTVHRSNHMATDVDDEMTDHFHYVEDLQTPEPLEKWRKQFYSLNIPPKMSPNLTPGSVICSETVHRKECFVPKVSGPLSLKDLPSPKSLLNKKRALHKRKLDNNGLPFSAAQSHLRDIKAKQAKFDWTPQFDLKYVNRKLNFETSDESVFSRDSEDPVATTPLIPLNDQFFENHSIQEEQVESKIPWEKADAFSFRPFLTFEDYKKQREIQCSSTKALFNITEE